MQVDINDKRFWNYDINSYDDLLQAIEDSQGRYYIKEIIGNRAYYVYNEYSITEYIDEGIAELEEDKEGNLVRERGVKWIAIPY